MIISTFIIILILTVTALLMTIYLKRKRINKAATIVRNSSEVIVNDAMENVIAQLDLDGIYFDEIKGKSVAEVWGRSVVGFNYEAELKKDYDPKVVEKKIDALLIKYCQKYHLENKHGVLLKISDIWINDSKLSFDVVYLINQQTRDYLKDLSKL